MYTVPVRVAGDIWCNAPEMLQALCQIPVDQPVLLDFDMEGPSIQALGILDELRSHCCRSGRDTATIILHRAPNTAEITEFKNTHVGPSHFFARAAGYWRGLVPAAPDAARLALFIGRATASRCCMMYELSQTYGSATCVFSVMHYDGAPFWEAYPSWRVCETLDNWLGADQQAALKQWWHTQRPGSIDGMSIQDQYRPDARTNHSLLDHYGDFHLELVCETYTLGDSFFPTEKTVRPISAGKPWLIYAPRHFVARLTDMGFQSYHALWDESYDQYQGPERWQRMRRSIRRLLDLDTHSFQAVMRDAYSISIHNLSVLSVLCGRS